MKLEVTKEVAIDVAQLLIREQAMYTTDESIVPERIKNIRSFIDEIADKVRGGMINFIYKFFSVVVINCITPENFLLGCIDEWLIPDIQYYTLWGRDKLRYRERYK